MGEQFFDDLAKGLDEGTISRGRALKLAGGALLAVVVPTLFPREAEALNKAKRRCRRRGGTYLSKGECHCATHCSHTISCNGTSSCSCVEKADGSGGFCANSTQGFTGTDCVTNPCQSGQTCIVIRGCSFPGVGGFCDSVSGCPNTSLGCIKGTCQFTACASPC